MDLRCVIITFFQFFLLTIFLCVLFYVYNFGLQIYMDPFIRQFVFGSVYRLHRIQKDQLELTVSTQFFLLEKYALGPKILTKMYQKGCQTKPLYFETLWLYFLPQCILLKTDCCIEIVSSSRSIWVPWSYNKGNTFLAATSSSRSEVNRDEPRQIETNQDRLR